MSEKYWANLTSHQVAGQKNLFPEVSELSASDYMFIEELLPDLEYLGLN
ncbi:MAG: hypothetical protein V8S95_13160 [Odoribacter sp.]